MKITAFAEQPLDLYQAPRGLAWYITTKRHKILFVTGSSESFWRHAEDQRIKVEEIDMVLLPQGCRDTIRELERFLRHNTIAKIYLPRMTHEKHVNALRYNLMRYASAESAQNWNDRIVFMDEGMDIDHEICIFTGRVQGRYEEPGEQSMILSEDGTMVLFINDALDTTEATQRKAEALSGENMDYLFYEGEREECVEENCATREMSAMNLCKEVVIGERRAGGGPS